MASFITMTELMSFLAFIRRSMGTLPASPSAKTGISASAKWANGDDLDFDEGDDDSMTTKSNSGLFGQAASPPGLSDKPPTLSPTTSVNVSFPVQRRDSLLGEPVTPSTPTADTFQHRRSVHFSTETSTSIPVASIASRENVPVETSESFRKNLI